MLLLLSGREINTKSTVFKSPRSYEKTKFASVTRKKHNELGVRNSVNPKCSTTTQDNNLSLKILKFLKARN